MTRKQYAQAKRLVDKLVEGVANPAMHDIAVELRTMLEPPPSMPQILAMVPGESILARAKALDISRQTYYNLADGTTRPSEPVAQRISQATGVAFEVVKEAFW